jgi:hypothetical protein
MQGPGIVKQNIEGRSAAPMSQFFQIHPENPQARLIRQAVDIVRAGGVIVYPTDSAYALGCQIGDKAALDRIRRIRRLDAATTSPWSAATCRRSPPTRGSTTRSTGC